mmetsp:Transcript_106765/g.227985  ORF Transcript_106765/g.227985 Transcript_106765/m.227985 type:complete len:463 (+) Transcript_106765:1291-2679(+)
MGVATFVFSSCSVRTILSRFFKATFCPVSSFIELKEKYKELSAASPSPCCFFSTAARKDFTPVLRTCGFWDWPTTDKPSPPSSPGGRGGRELRARSRCSATCESDRPRWAPSFEPPLPSAEFTRGGRALLSWLRARRKDRALAQSLAALLPSASPLPAPSPDSVEPAVMLPASVPAAVLASLRVLSCRRRLLRKRPRRSCRERFFDAVADFSSAFFAAVVNSTTSVFARGCPCAKRGTGGRFSLSAVASVACLEPFFFFFFFFLLPTPRVVVTALDILLVMLSRAPGSPMKLFLTEVTKLCLSRIDMLGLIFGGWLSAFPEAMPIMLPPLASFLPDSIEMSEIWCSILGDGVSFCLLRGEALFGEAPRGEGRLTVGSVLPNSSLLNSSTSISPLPSSSSSLSRVAAVLASLRPASSSRPRAFLISAAETKPLPSSSKTRKAASQRSSLRFARKAKVAAINSV